MTQNNDNPTKTTTKTTAKTTAKTEPKAAEPKAAEPKAAEPKAAEPKATEPKVAEPKVATGASSGSDSKEKALDTASKAANYVRGAGFKYLHLGKIALERRELEQKRLEVLQKIGLQCVQSIQEGVALDDTLFKTLYDSYNATVAKMETLQDEKNSVKRVDPADVKSMKYDPENN